MAVRTPEQLYEQARSAGLSHGTAQEVSHPTLVRGRLSGLWPTIPTIRVDDKRHAERGGEAPTIDSILWLKKLGLGLASWATNRHLVNAGLPIITNSRVRSEDWEKDGCIAIDLEHRKLGGRRVYTTCRVPIGACKAHDDQFVLMRVLAHLGQRNVTRIENALLSETDLRHVSG